MVVLVAVAMVVAVAVAVWRRRLKPPRRSVAAMVFRAAPAVVPRRSVVVPRSAKGCRRGSRRADANVFSSRASTS